MTAFVNPDSWSQSDCWWMENKENCSEQKYIMVAYGFKITLFRFSTDVKIW